MGTNVDLDQRIARPTAAEAGAALAAQPQDLAVARAGWNIDIEHGAVRQRELLLAAVDGVEKIKRWTMVSVWAAHADIAASLPAKHFGKDIVHSPEVGEASIARKIRARSKLAARVSRGFV